jgi:hypothetical protein
MLLDRKNQCSKDASPKPDLKHIPKSLSGALDKRDRLIQKFFWKIALKDKDNLPFPAQDL